MVWSVAIIVAALRTAILAAAKHAVIVVQPVVLEAAHTAVEVLAALEAVHTAAVQIVLVEGHTEVADHTVSEVDHIAEACHMVESITAVGLTVEGLTVDMVEAWEDVGKPTTPTRGLPHSSSAEHRSLIYHNILPEWPC